jgi:flagellar assembly factor FliW
MQVQTKPYGFIDIDERQKIHFPFGILGFESLKNYVMLDATQQPFYWLQSTDVSEVAFVLIDPFLFRPDYQIDIPDEELEEIGITAPEDILVFAIVTIPGNYKEMTANLQGPIIVNKKERIARQAITSNPKWKVRHYILEELSQLRA